MVLYPEIWFTSHRFTCFVHFWVVTIESMSVATSTVRRDPWCGSQGFQWIRCVEIRVFAPLSTIGIGLHFLPADPYPVVAQHSAKEYHWGDEPPTLGPWEYQGTAGFGTQRNHCVYSSFPWKQSLGFPPDVFVRRFKDCLGWISAGKWIERPLAIPCRGAGNGDVFVMTFEVSDGPKPHFSSIDHFLSRGGPGAWLAGLKSTGSRSQWSDQSTQSAGAILGTSLGYAVSLARVIAT